MTAAQASLEYRHLTEEAVRGALSDLDHENPIAAEVSRLIVAYLDNFARQAKQPGGLPPAALRLKGTYPIEAVALQMALKEIAAFADINGGY
jgi:hypothetical protein